MDYFNRISNKKKLNFKFDNIEISMTKNWKNWKNKVLEIQKSTELDSLVYYDYREWSIKRRYSNKRRGASLGIYKLMPHLCQGGWYKEISKPYRLRNKTSTNSWVLKV